MKNYFKTHHIAAATLAVVIAIFGLIMWTSRAPEIVPDELTGTWYASGGSEEAGEWWMEYTFENGSYTLETGTDYAEEGTYIITETFLDGSRLVEKTFYDGEKVYEMNVRIDPNEPDALYVENMRMERVTEE